MTSNRSDLLKKRALRRRHADERLALQRNHAAEREAAGLPRIETIDFDNLKLNESVWKLSHPAGSFQITFLNGNLYLTHGETQDAGGMEYSEELTEDPLDRLRFALNEHRAWRAGQRLNHIDAG